MKTIGGGGTEQLVENDVSEDDGEENKKGGKSVVGLKFKRRRTKDNDLLDESQFQSVGGKHNQTRLAAEGDSGRDEMLDQTKDKLILNQQ